MLMYAWNTTKAKTDEEYREVLRKRQKRFFILGMVGVITIMIGLYFSTMAKGPPGRFYEWVLYRYWIWCDGGFYCSVLEKAEVIERRQSSSSCSLERTG